MRSTTRPCSGTVIRSANDDDAYEAHVPTVDMPEHPRVRIYHPSNDGTYYFRDIGFTGTFFDDRRD